MCTITEHFLACCCHDTSMDNPVVRDSCPGMRIESESDRRDYFRTQPHQDKRAANVVEEEEEICQYHRRQENKRLARREPLYWPNAVNTNRY
jgi:hypothetical protein